jgi:ubiquinone/menaquinone biosynthesis C-methylase UbiE
MGRQFSSFLFNFVAPVYGLFFKRQRRYFYKVLAHASPEPRFIPFDSILDVGCGTGALCSILRDKGLSVTGMDPANNMLRIARRRPETVGIDFVRGNVLSHIPFEDKSFDFSIASYVAHGMSREDRIRMYREMGRVTRRSVIIHDYNQNRTLLISLIEWLERGDYFHFIRYAESEMKECMADMQSCFSDVHVIPVDTRAHWYVCTPR